MSTGDLLFATLAFTSAVGCHSTADLLPATDAATDDVAMVDSASAPIGEDASAPDADTEGPDAGATFDGGVTPDAGPSVFDPARVLAGCMAGLGSPRVHVGEAITIASAGRFVDGVVDAGCRGCAFVARLGYDGTVAWTLPLSSDGAVGVADVHVTADGSTVIGGGFRGTLSVSDQAISGAGFGEGYVAQISPTGVLQWITGFGSRGRDQIRAVGVDGEGRVLAAGTFEQTVDLGVTRLVSEGSTDVALVGFDGHGAYRVGSRLGGARRDQFGAAQLSGAEWLMTGELTPRISESPTADRRQFLATFHEDGRFGEARTFDDGLDFNAVFSDDASSRFVAGSFRSTVEMGGRTFTPEGMTDGLIVRFDSLTQVWLTRLGGPGSASAEIITPHGESLVVAGWFTETVHAGDFALTSAGDSDAFVASVTPAGRVAWAIRVGGVSNDGPRALVAADTGELMFVGHSIGPVTIGDGLASADCGPDGGLVLVTILP